MQKMNLNDRESKQVFIIKNKYRFKVKAGYYNNLVEFFKNSLKSIILSIINRKSNLV